MYSVKILRDSIAGGVRLTTMEVTFPRFILAEFNTHRVFSRNSASSRAIPVSRRLSQVFWSPFIPERFGANKAGMQAGPSLSGGSDLVVRGLWLLACYVCCAVAWGMSKFSAHKQHANRVIELWSWHTVVVTSTEWDNFLNLRTHKDSQPEMQIIASMMRAAYTYNEPEILQPGEWHLPYVTTEDRAEAAATLGTGSVYTPAVWDQLLKISVVRCAAVSFERQTAARTKDQIENRHDAMTKSAHWSPFEHVARVATDQEMHLHAVWYHPIPEVNELTPAFIGNFRAPWLQYRKTFQNESVWSGEQ